MEYNGFSFDASNNELNFIMPHVLRGNFKVVLYGRSKINDAVLGCPSDLWHSMSYNHNNNGLVAPVQVHDKHIIEVSEKNALPNRPEADGIFMDIDSRLSASLRFADCTPVVLAGSKPRPWLVLLHSGFVGTAKNIAGEGIKQATGYFGCEVSHDNSWAWIGPSICTNCYFRSVGDIKTIEAMSVFTEKNYKITDDKVFFDINGQIKYQLSEAGINKENIFLCSDCTCCGSGNFYSYRKGDKTARSFLLACNTTNLCI